LGGVILSIEFTWEVRKRNTGRFSILYQQKDGTPISLAGATADLYIYVSSAIALQKSCNILGLNQIDVFLTEAEILDFDFEVTDFEVIVEFSNGDKETFVDGRIVVKSGRGPFV
jgi:hypothetical protein